MNETLRGIPKLVVTDWDGTFSEQGTTPRPEAIQAKDQLLSQGSFVVLVSGRSTKEVLKYIHDYGLSSEFIAELGAIVYHDGKEYINHGDLRKFDGTHLYQHFVHFLDDEKMNAHDAMFRMGFVDKVLSIASEHHMPLKIFTPKDGRPGEQGTNLMEKKGTVLMRGKVNTDIIDTLLEQETPFLEIQDNGLVEDNSGDHAYHLLIKGANKDSAVSLLQQLLGIKQSESIALGDSLSDLTLAFVVERFYLMKNGLTHTPDILGKFQKQMEVLGINGVEEIMKRITVTKTDAGLGWAEAVNEISSL
jgi:HAD superfamily hydrolase (TIGR01484 family)